MNYILFTLLIRHVDHSFRADLKMDILSAFVCSLLSLPAMIIIIIIIINI